MILPQPILELYTSSKRQFSQSSSKMEQLTLARFMEEGYLDKHLRKIKKIYYRKNELIVNFIKNNARDKINILGHDSGLHMMFEITTDKEVNEILKDAESQSIYLELVEGFQKDKLVVVFTYSGLEENEIEGILDSLIKKVF